MRKAEQRHSSLVTLWASLESPWAAAWLCIRLWFTSALCDLQNIQLVLTAQAWSRYAEQQHIRILLSQVYFSPSLPLIIQTCLHWCVNKPVLTTLHPSIPVFIYLLLAAFTLLLFGSLRPPLVSCFSVLFAKDVAETGKWDAVWFLGKGKDDLMVTFDLVSHLVL